MASSAKILVVDDNQLILSMASDMLEGAGYEVVTQDSPLGVSSVVMKERPDLVLLDVNMPAISGDKVVDIIRKYDEFKNVPILFFSDRSEEDLDALTRTSGADGFIPKKYMGDRLIATVKAVLDAAGGPENVYEFSVLVVEGKLGEHDSIIKPLSAMGYKVDFATGAAEGFKAAVEGKHGMIIADDDMGGDGAIGFYESLVKKEARFEGRCIFLTKFPTTEFLTAVRKTGCYYLMKPFEATGLVDMVDTIREKSGINDKRNHVRYRWSGDCLIGGDTEIPAMVQDISAGGVKIRYEGSPLSFGATVSLNIKSMSIVRDATVMWSSKNGGDSYVGLQVDKEIPSISISNAISS